jgi:hypothetical protein
MLCAVDCRGCHRRSVNTALRSFLTRAGLACIHMLDHSALTIVTRVCNTAAVSNLDDQMQVESLVCVLHTHTHTHTHTLSLSLLCSGKLQPNHNALIVSVAWHVFARELYGWRRATLEHHWIGLRRCNDSGSCTLTGGDG